MGRLRGVVAVVFFGVVLLAGVLVAVPVEQAVAADASVYGPDGYFSELKNAARPVLDNETGTLGSESATGWVRTRRIEFGKAGSVDTYDNASVSGGYKTLGKGISAPGFGLNFGGDHLGSSTYTHSQGTSLLENEALLWAEDTVAGAGWTSDNSYETQSNGVATPSQLASTYEVAANKNYSSFEKSKINVRGVEGVCMTPGGCRTGGVILGGSWLGYMAFPLAAGDLPYYLGHSNGSTADNNLSCRNYLDNKENPEAYCAGDWGFYWLRTGNWNIYFASFAVAYQGSPWQINLSNTMGLRPAFRLVLDDLVLSADSETQGQLGGVVATGTGDEGRSLRLTFVDEDEDLSWWSAGVTGGSGSRRLSLAGMSELEGHSGLGWKVVDSKGTDDTADDVVLGSGKTNASGNMKLPEEAMYEDTSYDLYVWGQEDGVADTGVTNRATKPVVGSIQGWQVRLPASPEPFGIALSGETSGTLTAYRIGEYDEALFTQSGALKSVRLDTPTALKDTLKAAAVAAGGGDVDVENPIGWVASRWLGYPTDPSSDDVTSAFSPYAGSLQLFARALADRVSADGDGVLGGVQGSLHGLDAPVASPVTLPLSDEGLYLIVDSSGTSLPIIVGTKVFNDALGDDGGFVDFVDAGVKGKPRLGRAALKSDFMDVYKRIVNDAGLDGFDVGAEVEYEIALRVPDLAKLDGVVSFGDYVFEVVDVLPAGLDVSDTLGSVRVFVGDAERTGDASVTLQDGRLTVSGLKALFAKAGSSPVVNDAGVVPVNGVVRIRYAAVLADGALVSKPGVDGLKPNANTVTLTRSTGPTLTEEKTATANAYSFKVDVVKLDKDKSQVKLGGAKFEVSRDGQVLKFVQAADGVYRLAVQGETGTVTQVVSSSSGSFSLLGVEARELSFKETNAPSGYFKVSDFGVDIRPEWDADATQVTKVTYATAGTNLAYVSQEGKQVVVLDPAWSLANLPYTGGVGILVLLIIGGLILAFAIRPYALSKRAERDANLV